MPGLSANLVYGIVRPVLRCLGIVAIGFALALLIGMATGEARSVSWALIAMIPPMIWIESKRKDARRREQAARNALFGVGNS